MSYSKSKHIATLIMAAGSSSRMGKPKQLLKWGNSTLIETCIKKCLQLNTTQTIVVLGDSVDEIASKINSYPIEVIHNKNWSKGLGNSIAYGVKYIQNNYKVGGVLIVLVDQPFVDILYLKRMIDSFETDNNQIIATKYQNEKVGVPVLFDKCYFKELSNVDGDKGAKLILDKYSDPVKFIDQTTNVMDIDTEEDYIKLTNLITNKTSL